MNSLQRISSCTKASFHSYFRSKSTIAWLLVFPILLTTVSGAIVYVLDHNTDSSFTVYVQNNDSDNPISQRFILELEETTSVSMIDPSEDIDSYIAEHPGRMIIVIPDDLTGWIAKSISEKGYSLNVHYEGNVFEMTVRDSITDGNPEIVIPSDIETISQLQNVLNGESGNPYKSYLSTILVVCVMNTIMSIILGHEISMRRNNVSRVLRFTRLKNWEWEISQILWTLVPALIASLIAYMVMCVFSIVSFTAAGLALLVLFAFSVVPLALIFSKFVPNPESASAASAVAIIPVVQLSGGIIPLYLMPDAFYWISRIFPMTYAIDGLRTAVTFSDFIGCAVPIIVLTIVLSAIWLYLCARKNNSKA